MPSRREFVRLLAGTTAAVLGCRSTGLAGGGGSARLLARPAAPTHPLTPGTWTLGLGTRAHDGLLLIPQNLVAGRPTPLVVGLHGAGARASDHINFFGPYAETYGFLLLAPDSYGPTWDAVDGGYGPDVAFIDQALAHTFDRCTVDPARIVIEGFSDGASTALGLGLANGDLFRRVVAFSPGFVPPSDTTPHGTPEFFISHGRQDPILPIDGASRTIVAALRGAGYAVNYVEFDGGHQVPPAIADAGAQWLVR